MIEMKNTLSFPRPARTLLSKKYGVGLIRYTNGDTEKVIYSSNRVDGESYEHTNNPIGK